MGYLGQGPFLIQAEQGLNPGSPSSLNTRLSPTLELLCFFTENFERSRFYPNMKWENFEFSEVLMGQETCFPSSFIQITMNKRGNGSTSGERKQSSRWQWWWCWLGWKPDNQASTVSALWEGSAGESLCAAAYLSVAFVKIPLFINVFPLYHWEM